MPDQVGNAAVERVGEPAYPIFGALEQLEDESSCPRPKGAPAGIRAAAGDRPIDEPAEIGLENPFDAGAMEIRPIRHLQAFAHLGLPKVERRLTITEPGLRRDEL